MPSFFRSSGAPALSRAFVACLLALGGLFVDNSARAATRFENALKARVENGYATLLFADGTKTMVPLASLADEDRALVTALSARSPLAHGQSAVVIAKETVTAKHTIQVSTVVGPLETIQLCPPAIARDQIGATCMLYGRVHWLDIAGYPLDNASIYRVSADADPSQPWTNPRYLQGLDALLRAGRPPPVIHPLPAKEGDAFEWARRELRQGRPILAAFPREIWQALPPGFVAAHPWGGGRVGHQVVINGFTWNRETGQGTFHIINSWAELPEFDLKTEAAQGGALIIEQSLSPRGELVAAAAKETVLSVTLLRAAGRTNLYEVETKLGKRRVAAASEAAARALVEDEKHDP